MTDSGRFAALRDKAKRGFRGYPVATIAYYGPDASRATKVAVGIIAAEGEEPSVVQRWHSADTDVRFDQQILGAALDFIAGHHVKTVALSARIIGCPHEEGIDYPLNEKCPACLYWAERDRWTGEITR